VPKGGQDCCARVRCGGHRLCGDCGAQLRRIHASQHAHQRLVRVRHAGVQPPALAARTRHRQQPGQAPHIPGPSGAVCAPAARASMCTSTRMHTHAHAHAPAQIHAVSRLQKRRHTLTHTRTDAHTFAHARTPVVQKGVTRTCVTREGRLAGDPRMTSLGTPRYTPRHPRYSV
jgi:hypothetical protein